MSIDWMIQRTLVADASRLSEMGQNFRDPTTSTSTLLFYVGCLALLLAFIACSSWAIRRWLNRREQRIEVQRWRLFRELCQIHGLKRTEMIQLRRLAKVINLSNPAMLFVRPDCFEVERPSRFFTTEVWTQLQKLRDQLFARRLECAG